MCDFVLAIETRHLLTGEVRFIVENNDVGEPKATYYVMPQELDNLLPVTSESGIASTDLVK